MKSIFAHEFSRVDLGHRGEHLARRILFDLVPWQETYGFGVATLAALLPGAETPYPCTVSQEGNVLIWPLTAADTSVAGKGKCELSYYVGEQLVKSVIFQTYTAEALAPVGDPPDPKDSWLEDTLAASADAIAARQAIEALSVSCETLDDDSPAAVSKTQQDGHVHFHFSLPRGERGEKGEIGDAGPKGDTPMRGVDYFTADDIAYFDRHIDDRLGAVSDALDELHAYAQALVYGGDAT